METFLKRSIKASYKSYYNNPQRPDDKSNQYSIITLASISFIEIKQVIVWFFLISNCTIFQGKLKSLVDNVKRMGGIYLVRHLKIDTSNDYVIFKKEIFELAIPEGCNELLNYPNDDMIKIARAIANNESLDDFTPNDSVKAKRSKSSNTDKKKIEDMITYIYDCTLSTRSEDITPYLERNGEGSFLTEVEEEHLFSHIASNLSQMKGSRMRFKTYRYYQMLKSFIHATESLLLEFQYLTVDLESYDRDMMMMEDPEYYTRYFGQQDQQQSTTNGGDEQGDELEK